MKWTGLLYELLVTCDLKNATSKLQCSILRLILPTSHNDEEQNIAFRKSVTNEINNLNMQSMTANVWLFACRDITEVEAEQKMLQEAISNAREREKRSLLRAMNKGKSETKEKEQDPTDNPEKAGDLFKAESLEAYAGGATRDDEDEVDSEDDIQVIN
ncbi:hypothetical protein CTI12_AA537640 [Artemisia annua]|uniref:Uncharacterized protein n=1 Tax=Artemisia annua TaxID=35608 RepID=A0A2U1L2I4_ARTAN|nr:hypothetical protein CTI12_AA537640 [Artemisia annua]